MASHDHFMEQYHVALCSEIQKSAQPHYKQYPIKTLFLGGGTPSTYPENLLLDMFGILNKVFAFESDAEITIEVNPGTVTREKMNVWKECGINRLSIGVQSLNDEVLKKLNRHQKASDVVWLIEHASDVFPRLSIDLILGLPGISEAEWKKLILTVVKWPIKHLSVYFLTVHEDTPLYFKVQTNRVTLVPDDTMIDLYTWTRNTLEDAGFIQYEISNFAVPGFESIHNKNYWNHSTYKGFGLGACSFDGESRFQNIKNLTTYCKNIEESQDVTLSYETLTQQQLWLEKLMLGLRQRQGIKLDLLTEHLSPLQQEKFAHTIAVLCTAALVECADNEARLTPAGLALENEVILKLSMIL